MADQVEVDVVWTPWSVVSGSGFEIAGDVGDVSLIQRSAVGFLVRERFRFSDDAVEGDLREKLQRAGKGDDEIRERIERARTFSPAEDKLTDLASIPVFIRWFENTYGSHTLAAILHDELIVSEPNAGALGSDTLADRYFRKMLQASGTPWLKRWIMWTGVAMRSRWAAGGWRRYSLILWAVLAVVGIGAFVAAVIWSIAAGGIPGGAVALLAIALALPFASAALWGEQWGASVVAALAGVFVIPAAAFVLLGLGIYWVIERLAARLGRT